MSSVHLIDHPLVQHKLTIIRDQATGPKDFRDLVEEMSMLMAYEVTRDMPLEDLEVETPIGRTTGKVIAGRQLGIVPILRAGLGMVGGVLKLIPAAKVGHIGVYRDPDTLKPVEYYCKLPVDVEERQVIVLDPMLATGGSAAAAIKYLKERNVTSIKFMCIVAAPEGIELMQNFNLPYSAVSIKDFWARWHISLSTWFRDYIYIPLGGNRRGKLRKHINVMIVFLVSGLWHGADWTFVIWGALHGVYQIIGDITKEVRDTLYAKLGADVNGKPIRAIRRTITFLLVSFAWMFFRADSFADIGILIRRMFSSWSVGTEYLKQTFTLMDLNLTGALSIVLALFILYFLDHMPARELFMPVQYSAQSESASGQAQKPVDVPAPALAVAGGEKADFSGGATANKPSDEVALLQDEQLTQADVITPDKYSVGAVFTAACRYARIVWIILAAAMVMSAGGTESSFIYVQF